MFGGAQNPYDEIVAKTTDENLTSENWELILNLCDKVQDEGEQGARNVVAAVLKRLAHRNANVQLYALALAESLSKNCGKELHRELASRSFTQGLEKIITDRNTHEKVKRRTLYLIRMWASDFEHDPDLGLMEECYDGLKAKNYKFDDTIEDAPAPSASEEAQRREEEELMRVLELSKRDKGGRSNWVDYNGSVPSAGASSSSASGSRPAASSSGAAGASSSRAPAIAFPIASPSAAASSSVSVSAQPPTTSASPAAAPGRSTQSLTSTTSEAHALPPLPPAHETSRSAAAPNLTTVSRVRALHAFQPSEPGELPFEKGDIIKVVDRGYKDWWRGQLKGRTGIFPVNYVEPLPDLTPSDFAREAEQEAAVFAEAANIDKLLKMLRSIDPAKDNLADNEEIQELYRSSMTLRPKIVKLIDKYSQKRAELVSMNENFVKARRVFDQMMEESLAKHNPGAVYDYSQPEIRAPARQPRPQSPGGVGPDYRTPSTYGWNPAVYARPPYEGYPPQSPYPPQEPSYVQPYPPQTPDPNQYNVPPGPGPVYGPPEAGAYGPHPNPGYLHPQGVADNHSQPNLGVPQVGADGGQQQYSLVGQGYFYASPSTVTESLPVSYANTPLQQTQPLQPVKQGAGAQAGQQQQQQPPAQQTQQTQQQQPQQQQQQAVHQGQEQQDSQQGPPYIWNPNTQYADPNVQLWAQYYAQGGDDPSGRVYFTPDSLPGPGAPALQPGVDAGAMQGQPQVQQQQQHAASGHTSQSPGPAAAVAGGQYAAPSSPTHGGQPQTAYGASPYAPAPSGSPHAHGAQQGQFGAMQQGFAGLSVADGRPAPATAGTA